MGRELSVNFLGISMVLKDSRGRFVAPFACLVVGFHNSPAPLIGLGALIQSWVITIETDHQVGTSGGKPFYYRLLPGCFGSVGGSPWQMSIECQASSFSRRFNMY